MQFQTFKTPIGSVYLLADNKKLHAAIFKKNWNSYKKHFKDIKKGDNAVLRRAKKQLSQYFKGKRRNFNLPYDLKGTAFEKRAWLALKKVPYGQTRSYKDQAKIIHSPKASRAIGRANGLNPLCIILPCHRIIGSNGALTGYAGGLKAKKHLLALENKKA